MSLSVKTVSTYRTRLLQKLAISSNAELVQYAMRNGLVD
jgi:DNA-binding NarL/FixJ family response regulator